MPGELSWNLHACFFSPYNTQTYDLKYLAFVFEIFQPAIWTDALFCAHKWLPHGFGCKWISLLDYLLCNQKKKQFTNAHFSPDEQKICGVLIHTTHCSLSLCQQLHWKAKKDPLCSCPFISYINSTIRRAFKTSRKLIVVQFLEISCVVTFCNLS